MSIVYPTYIDVISRFHPDLQVSASNANDYSSIVYEGNDVLPSQTTLDEQRLELVQERMWKLIQVERDRRKGNGVKVGDNWFHSDDSSRIQQIALVIFGANLPANIMWKTLNGVFVEMTPTLATQIFQSSVSQDMTIFGAAEQHKAAMMASADPANYDFSANWPPTYTGSLLL